MKRKIGVAAMMALMASAAVATSALAQCDNGNPAPLLKWDANGFAYETDYNPATFHSNAGSQLVVVGKIVLFCSPFQDLDATDPTKEYTFLFAGLESQPPGTAHNNVGLGTIQHLTDYGSGVFFIYEDTTPDAPDQANMPPNPPNAQVPANYIDGTLILEGVLANFQTTVTQADPPGPPPPQFTTSFLGNYQFTGPALSPYFQRIVGSLEDHLQGLWCANGTGMGLCSIPAGYSAHPSGKFDQPPATTAIRSTWGSIKQLYR